jgi:L-alanine-DL-glutamate epimerase-like enolase superfamily enzyme
MFGTYMLVDDLVTDESKVVIEDGFALPPTRPGLGVEIDESALSKYSEDSFEVR